MSPGPGAAQTAEGPFIQTLAGQRAGRPPLWLMRQAGRYLPEYREIRGKAQSFLDFCFNPQLATEATLQPIRRFGFDAAILFSDILVVPYALGQEVSFESGEGPSLAPLQTAHDLARLAARLDLGRLAPVFETVERVRASLPRATALIGFCGAPWTVASYMIAGRATSDQHPARLFAYREPELLQRLIDLLVEASVDYLDRQFEAGADAVQIFDSWAGALPAAELARWGLAPVTRLIRDLRLRRPGARIIVFSRVVSSQLLELAGTCGADAIGLDTIVDPDWAAGAVQPIAPVQGNLDPLLLLAGGRGLDTVVDRILAAFAGGPHIFNLGHGILPDTPVENVQQLVRRVRGSG
ncbi:MAG: uroporphyrinogen decarboxylase [Methylobacteriaceae bacterium]|nr:uroporphyrinogen decarboxylase [Methylobacteriaceae bacterium]